MPRKLSMPLCDLHAIHKPPAPGLILCSSRGCLPRRTQPTLARSGRRACARLGCSCARVKQATEAHRKQRHASLRLHTLVASSRANSTPAHTRVGRCGRHRRSRRPEQMARYRRPAGRPSSTGCQPTGLLASPPMGAPKAAASPAAAPADTSSRWSELENRKSSAALGAMPNAAAACSSLPPAALRCRLSLRYSTAGSRREQGSTCVPQRAGGATGGGEHRPRICAYRGAGLTMLAMAHQRGHG